ncbi:MAG: hypothetical protein GY870_07670, partial [archaeon]|nr:hypothetical protein [archaeon]
YFPKSINKSLLKGILHISLKNYAIASVTAEPVIQDLLSLKIEQEYIQENNHYLPLKLNYVLSFKKYPSKKYGLKMESYTHIKKYQFNTSENFPLKSVDNLTSMDKLRSFKLTPKEQLTYKWTDSLGLAKNFDGKLNFLNKFSQAKIPFKIIDFDLSQLQYNLHERHRIGIGAFTNEKLSKRFTVGGYFAYGTGDKQNKYGALLSYKLLKPKIEIETSYKTDLTERGAISNQTYVKPDYWRNMMKDSLNRVESYGFSVKKNYKNSSVLVGIKKERIEDLNFSLEKSDFSEIYFSAKINFNKLEQKIYDPNNPSYKYPLFYFTYLKGLNTGEGDFSYSRISLSLDYNYYLERFGKQSIFITYEKLSGNKKLPYYKLITGYGANSTSLPFFAAKYFQTMLPYQFTHTESIVLHFNHSFLKPLFYSKLSEPKISLL